MARLRYNNESGTLGAALTNSGTTVTFTSAPNFATLTGQQYIPLFLDAGTGSFEIVYLTAYTSGGTTGTIKRAAEDSTHWPAVAHNSGSGTWACAYSATTDWAISSGASLQGVYIPQAWGQFLGPALTNAGTTPTAVALVGDSIAQGFYASNLATTSWASLLRIALQNAYGNGGSGMFAMSNGGPFWTANGNSGATTYYTTTVGTNNFMQLSGTFSTPTMPATQSNGPGTLVQFPTGTTATMTVTVIGTQVTVYYANVGPHFTVTISGGGGGTISPAASGTYSAGTTNIVSQTFTGLTSGSHTVAIQQTATGTGQISIGGIRGTNTTGVTVDNYGAVAMTSQFSSNYQETTAAIPQLSGVWQGGVAQASSLVIYGMCVNDMNDSVDPDQYAEYVTSYMQGVLDSGTSVYNGSSFVWDTFTGSPYTAPTGATDVIFLIPHFGQYDIGSEGSNYVSRISSLASKYNALVIDMNTIGRSSWAYWDSLNYWGNGTTPSLSGHDVVHPSDAGHKLYADTIVQALNYGLQINQGFSNSQLMALP
jgi:lysophospholipase L1-like esterase